MEGFWETLILEYGVLIAGEKAESGDLLRSYKRNMDAQAKENEISRITTKKEMRDLHTRYGNFGAAKKLDEQIKQCLEEMEE